MNASECDSDEASEERLESGNVGGDGVRRGGGEGVRGGGMSLGERYKADSSW